MLVSDLMTPNPDSVSDGDPIHKAAKLMRDNDYGVLPVVDGLGTLVGIVTDRDIVTKAVAAGHGPDTPVSDCMTRDPDTVPRDITIEQATRLMSNRQIRRLPVVENAVLIGMLSLGDIAASGTPAGEKADTLSEISLSGEVPRGAASNG